jgi:predicted nucleic acid-binding Zn ribbon protein
VRDLVQDRSWERTLNAAGLMPRWAEIVGAEVAEHCRPVRLTDGELVCVAESTAWATQLRLLNRQLLARIAAEVGDGVVTRIRVHGPSAPDWRHGPLRVLGRGPRDTYG